MHAVLDVAEVLMTESMSKDEIESFYRRVYRPDRPVVSRSAPEEAPDPAGFDVESQRESFSAFAKMARGFE
nr:hypothetical protein [Nocardia cyriacigeorgica]